MDVWEYWKEENDGAGERYAAFHGADPYDSF